MKNLKKRLKLFKEKEKLIAFFQYKLEEQKKEYEQKLKQKDQEIESLSVEIDNLIYRCVDAERGR